ncbi:Ferredoxin [Halopenitus malekzadehii]|uniref:Ferredoxin n=1 Tax=Halopenitus malekzadehii TaxID=1267564 RepID=A0A1H6I1A8_9EURY|nr:ferredoxin [Halopenitus malekzadehii]SEH40278.1 Ferredoxin [Halopenitus malekzadehii]
MTTDSAHGDGAYRVTLDRDACEGVFACLVRDERFREAADGLATIDDGGADHAGAPSAGGSGDSDTLVARFDDDRIAEAQQAAAACPVDAIAIDLEVAPDE